MDVFTTPTLTTDKLVDQSIGLWQLTRGDGRFLLDLHCYSASEDEHDYIAGLGDWRLVAVEPFGTDWAEALGVADDVRWDDLDPFLLAEDPSLPDHPNWRYAVGLEKLRDTKSERKLRGDS
jgi:hypothetical protein